ncbi:hypothetical protein K525DRAFT_196749 [Schizophyllum commune Loenen D]|nr:hypothetical protein K525DRAFT_196749 [Schizophyllum commune Loenen D]
MLPALQKINPFRRRRRTQSDAGQNQDVYAQMYGHRLPTPADYGPPFVMQSQVPPHERVSPREVMHSQATQQPPEPPPLYQEHQPHRSHHVPTRRQLPEDQRPRQGRDATDLQRAGAITGRTQRHERASSRDRVAFPPEMATIPFPDGPTLRERRPGTPAARARGLHPPIPTAPEPGPSRGRQPIEHQSRHNTRRDGSAPPDTNPARGRYPLQQRPHHTQRHRELAAPDPLPQPIQAPAPRQVATPAPLPLQAPDLQAEPELSSTTDSVSPAPPDPPPPRHKRSVSAPHYSYAHAGNTPPSVQQQIYHIATPRQDYTSSPRRVRDDEGLVWLALLLGERKQSTYLKSHKGRPPTLRTGAIRADLLRDVVALCKKLSGRIGYAYTPPSNDPAGQDEETTATYALAKECAIEPMNDPDLFDKAFYCIVALAVVRYLGAQLTEYHWNAFKSSAPQAATENAMFFMRLAIQRSPAGQHMSMEGTLDELLIKGELP